MEFVADGGSQPAQQAEAKNTSFWDAINPFSSDGAMSEQALSKARDAAQGLKDAASQGKFAISESAIPDMMKALNDAEDQITGMSRAIDTIQQAPQLGSSDYSTQVSAHTRKSGTGGQGSAFAVIEQFREVVNLTRDALNIAKKNYAQNESGNVQTLNAKS
ncbi:hypothetical protein HFP15_11540 [Amycolatopsis sp. K13G38]|uniref:Uncharacterized protein n=1 Tax=Amycolatopsis acididurans TaxID=2724524 RepID=A0ABX1J3J1_9PSEU|nr:hypothetical protein [Amycolatopsis acididurans]NKQ53514.1 hypothetical protein [Amycolatopsis acididurans]